MNSTLHTQAEEFENQLSMVYGSTFKINDLLHELSNGRTNERIAAIDAAVARRRSESAPRQEYDKHDYSDKSQDAHKNICLVTEEIANIGPSGGIGAAFAELAMLLAGEPRHRVTILYTNFYAAASGETKKKLEQFAEHTGCIIEILSPGRFANPDFQPQHVSYAAMRWLQEHAKKCIESPWDFVHFHDYKGIGYYSALRNRQKPGSIAHKLVVQAHGPSRWAIEANGKFFSSEEQLIIDFMERKSLELCDQVVSPSHYLINWLSGKGWQLATAQRNPAVVIQNLRSAIPGMPEIKGQDSSAPVAGPINEIIYFGRHEARKGLKTFLAAIQILDNLDPQEPLNVTILGALGEIGETPSLLFLENATKKLKKSNLKLITSFDRDEAIRYLSKDAQNKLVCICSDYENSPYTVVEAAQCGCMLIMSTGGGGKELVLSDGYSGCITMTGPVLAEAITDAISHPCNYVPRLSETNNKLKSYWLKLHQQHEASNQGIIDTEHRQAIQIPPQEIPLVSFVITHFNRPSKLIEAVRSALLQTYPRLEIIVVDDGTPDETALHQLRTTVEPLLKLSGDRIIYRKNGYLGAARNTGLEHANGEYIVFMDDDDIAMPSLVSCMVEAALNSPSDALIPLNTYMPLSQRDSIRDNRFSELPLPSYIPIGSIASLSPLHNYIGACTSLIRVSALRSIGGYTEQRDVGHEDYEAYVRLHKAGYKIDVLPEVLYLYETQRPSMLSNTTLWKNFRRSIEAHGLPQEIQDLVLCFKGKSIEEQRAARIRWIHNDPSLIELFEVWPANLDSLRWMIHRLERIDPESELLKGIYRGLNY